MVTNDISENSRRDLAKIWEVIEVERILCHHKHTLDATKYDLKGERYLEGVRRWSPSCTKFAAWKLTQFEKIIFMDSDMLVVGTIDDAINVGNSSFMASPESFPPDTFNSGFMVIKPSLEGFRKLLLLNEEVGSVEGGDQGVLNNGLCPNWFTVHYNDPDCGRLPWIYNVQAAYYDQYKTLREMNGLRVPSVIHFVSDGKPWKVLAFEYIKGARPQEETLRDLGKQAQAHLLWRAAFFKVPRHDTQLRTLP